MRHTFDCLLAITLNDGPVGNHTIFRDDDDSVADVVERVIYIFRLASGSDNTIATDPGVLVDNRIFEKCIFPNSNPRTAGHFVLKNGGFGFEVVAPEVNDAIQPALAVHQTSNANNAACDFAVIQNAPV